MQPISPWSTRLYAATMLAGIASLEAAGPETPSPMTSVSSSPTGPGLTASPSAHVTPLPEATPMGSSASLPTTALAMSKSLPAASKAVRHPLTPVIKFARDEADYIERTIRDFSCRVTKRERIDGELQDYMYLNLSVRQAVKRDEQVVEPYSVFVSFLGPKKVRGRKVLFIEGENEGKMLVRNGGERFSFVVVPISIDSDAVRRESQLLITDIGFDRMAKSMVKLLEKHAALDPQASNTQVNVFKNAKINDRACTRVQIVHPQEQERLEFHMVNVFVDDELHVPVRVEKYLWPASAGQEAILDAEYTYTNLVINPGLSNSYFTRENLKQSGKSTKAKKP